ncbi:Ig family protein [Achlya hypogyna]|uniref:Ig family protein n=1 Tax=Achlya hypogyna TaxID=1202772 RepID=A0A1V9YLC1_ACHHY|nr:Ig family protein [Achlya hypogyna]
MADGPATTDGAIQVTKVHRLMPIDSQASFVKRRSVITSFRRESAPVPAGQRANSHQRDLNEGNAEIIPRSPQTNSAFSMSSSKILPTIEVPTVLQRTSVKYKVQSNNPRSVKGKRTSILNRAQSIRMLQEKVSFVSRRRQIFKRTRQGALVILLCAVVAAVVLLIALNSAVSSSSSCCSGAQPYIVSLFSGIKAMAMTIDVNGTIYIASASTNQLYTISAGVLSNFAGTGDYGSVDGPLALAQFRYPCGIAVDNSGTVYVADRDNLAVRKISNGIVSTIPFDEVAGTLALGGFDNAVDGALVNAPVSIAVDSRGILYVGCGTFVQVINPDGSIDILAGNGLRGYADGYGPSARFNSIRSIAVDTLDKYLYVTDYYNKVIRRIEIATTIVSSLTATGFKVTSGGGNVTTFMAPTGIFLVNSTLYAVDTYNNSVVTIDLNGTVIDCFGNGLYGTTDGLNGSFGNPTSVVVNGSNVVYVGDIGNLMIRMVIY